MIEEINEAVARRNLVVHNDGIINNMYLNKVDTSFIAGKKGESINITVEYLNRVIDIIKIFGTIILLEAWKSFERSESKQRFDYIERIGYKSLTKKEWEFGKYLYDFMLDDDVQNYPKTLAQINIWLCEKEMGNFDSIENDIRKFDVSGMKTFIELSIYSLLEEKEKFFNLLENDPDCIGKEELKKWPIFSIMREDTRINKFLIEN